MVDPRGAEMELRPTVDEEYSPSTGDAFTRHFLLRRGLSSAIPATLQEYCIRPGDHLFVVATLRENPGFENAADCLAGDAAQERQGFLSAVSDDFATASIAAASSSTLPVCEAGGILINYLFKYTENNINNEMAHIDISGSSQGQVTMHELTTAGRSDAKGRVTDGSVVIDITDGDGALTESGFFYTITGTLTDLATGAKCQIAHGSLSGSLVGEIIP